MKEKQQLPRGAVCETLIIVIISLQSPRIFHPRAHCADAGRL